MASALKCWCPAGSIPPRKCRSMKPAACCSASPRTSSSPSALRKRSPIASSSSRRRARAAACRNTASSHSSGTMFMAHQAQIKIPATYMRGGTSKGVFFRLQDLPQRAQTPGAARDALLLRVIGSPDPYGKQIDGMGGATSSTSKTVIVSASTRPGHDVDYLFGQVSIDSAFVDWSGNCGNLSAAVGPFAISNGLIDASRIPRDGMATVRSWQANIGKTIIAHVPMTDGEVQETGDFELDGVTFPAAEVQLEFIDPAAEEEGAGGAMFPTGNLVDDLDVPG